MKVRHVLSGAALVGAVLLVVIGSATGAAALVGLATLIELVASAVYGKQKNTGTR